MNIKNMPIPAARALKKLGEDLKNARKLRRITMRPAAERAGISRTTLTKVEKGDAGVSMGVYVKVFFILGLISRLSETADIMFDKPGQAPEAEHLPSRVRHKNRA